MGATKNPTDGDLLPGTLDMLILKTVSREAMHGYSIAEFIQGASRDVLKVEEGALYPALHRLEVRGRLKSEWATSENKRRAKFDRLPARGHRHRKTESADRKSTPLTGSRLV